LAVLFVVIGIVLAFLQMKNSEESEKTQS